MSLMNLLNFKLSIVKAILILTNLTSIVGHGQLDTILLPENNKVSHWGLNIGLTLPIPNVGPALNTALSLQKGKNFLSAGTLFTNGISGGSLRYERQPVVEFRRFHSFLFCQVLVSNNLIRIYIRNQQNYYLAATMDQTCWMGTAGFGIKLNLGRHINLNTSTGLGYFKVVGTNYSPDGAMPSFNLGIGFSI